MTKYRFKVGDKVLCYFEHGWIDCVVVSHDYYDKTMNEIAVYQLKQSSDGLFILVFDDTGHDVREYVSEPIEMLELFIKYHDSIEEINKYIVDNKINIYLIEKELLVLTAKYGNSEVLIYLVKQFGFDPTSTVDNSGRNILHVALMRGQSQYLFDIYFGLSDINPPLPSSFILSLDKSKRCPLHYAVIANDKGFFEVLAQPITSSGSTISHCAFIGAVETPPYNSKERTWDPQSAFDIQSNGHTPYGLAITMNRPELAELILRCRGLGMVESFAQFLLSNLTYHNRDRTEGAECLRYTLSESLELFRQHNVDLANTNTSHVSICLQHCAFHFASRGELTYLKWLMDAWRVGPVLDSDEVMQPDDTILTFIKNRGIRFCLLDAVVMGPIYTYMTTEVDVIKPIGQTALMNKALNKLFENRYWEPTMSVEEHIEAHAMKPKEEQYIGRKYPSIHPLETYVRDYQMSHIDRFVDSFVARIDGACVDERLATLNYLCGKLRSPLPPLLLTVSLGQHHVLAWVAARRDLTKPLGSDPGLMREIKRVDWLSGVNLSDSIASLLCYYAIGLGEIAVVQWLLEHFEEIESCRVGGMNMLHFATAHDRVPCVIWLVRHYSSLVAELTDSGHNVLQLAIQCRCVWLTRFYMGVAYPDTHFESLWEDDSSGHGVYWRLAHSQEPEFKSWVQQKAQVTALESIISVLDEGPLSARSLEYLLAAVSFTDILQSLDLARICEEWVWTTGYSVDSLCFECSLLSLMALLKKTVSKRRWDLLAVIFNHLYDCELNDTRADTLKRRILSVAEDSGPSAVAFIERAFDPIVGGPEVIQWETAWLELCNQLPVAFLGLRVDEVINNIEQQRCLEESKPAHASRFHAWSHRYLFASRGGSCYDIEIVLKSELYPMTPLNYAITNDCEPLVRWMLNDSIFKSSGDASSAVYVGLEAAVMTDQFKYLELLLDQDWATTKNKSSDLRRSYYRSAYGLISKCNSNKLPLKDSLLRQLVAKHLHDVSVDDFIACRSTLVEDLFKRLLYSIDIDSEVDKVWALLHWLLALKPSVPTPEPPNPEDYFSEVLDGLHSRLDDKESTLLSDELYVACVDAALSLLTLLQRCLILDFTGFEWSKGTLSYSLGPLFAPTHSSSLQHTARVHKPNPAFKLLEYFMREYDNNIQGVNLSWRGLGVLL